MDVWLLRFMKGHKKVKRVFYPGLAEHPHHELAARQQMGFGSMISIETGSLENANAFAKRLRLAVLAESLGGVETLVCHPATMTHAAVGAEARARMGITDGLMRVSVGIEDVEDIIADLGRRWMGWIRRLHRSLSLCLVWLPSSSRAMTMRRISLVPSPMVHSFTSR